MVKKNFKGNNFIIKKSESLKPYSEKEVKRIVIGDKQFELPVKRLEGETRNQDRLIILGELKNNQLKMPPTEYQSQIIKAVKRLHERETGVKINEQRIHLLRNNDNTTMEFVKKAFHNQHPLEITKEEFSKQLQELKKLDSRVMESEKARQFMSKLKGVTKKQLPKTQIQDFYKTLLTERLEKIDELTTIQKQKSLPAAKETKLLTGKPEQKLLKAAERHRLLKGVKQSDRITKDSVTTKSNELELIEKVKEKQENEVKEEHEESHSEEHSEKEEKDHGDVNVNVQQGAVRGGGGYGMYPHYSHEQGGSSGGKKEEEKKVNPLAPKNINIVAFAIILIIIILVLSIIFQ